MSLTFNSDNERAIAAKNAEILTEEQQKAYYSLLDWVFTPIDANNDTFDNGQYHLLSGSAGTGKALVNGTPVLTPTGWVAIESLKVGDLVISQDGTATLVIGVYPQGLKETAKVTMNDATSVETCTEHLWKCWNERERKKQKRTGKDTSNIRTTYEISQAVSPRGGRLNFNIPVVQPVQFTEQQLPIHPYVLGVLLGDGCVRGSCVKITTPDIEVILKVGGLLPKGVFVKQLNKEIEYSLNLDKEIHPSKGVQTVHPIRLALRSLSIDNKLSYEKSVPDCYLFNTIENRIALLQGLMDTDGTVGKNGCVVFGTTSLNLAEAVKFLVQSLGGTCRMTQQILTSTRIFYRVCINMLPEINPFSLSRKADRAIPKIKRKPTKYITKVEPNGLQECTCIAVAHESKLFVTKDFIVTHNTFLVSKFTDTYKQIKDLRGQSTEICAIAPTHKASGVLHDVFSNSAATPHISTVHSACHLVPGDFNEHGERMLKVNPYGKSRHLSEFNLAIIDEKSMLDEQLLNFIQCGVASRQKVLFSGDKYQLPPVKKSKEEIPNDYMEVSPIYELGIPEVSLTIPVRYAGDIAKFAALLRDCIEARDTHLPFPESGDNLSLLTSLDWETQLFDMVRENNSETRVVAWTNKYKNNISNNLRIELYGDINYHVDEILITQEPIIEEVIERGRLKEIIRAQTCQELKVIGIGAKQQTLTSPNTYNQLSLEFLTLNLENKNNNRMEVLTPHHDDLPKVREFFKLEKKHIIDSPESKGKKWREYYRMLNNLCLSVKGNTIIHRLQYAGCLTINTAQGSGYPNVFIPWFNIYGCQNFSHRLRLAYTALTRAKQHAYILGKKEELVNLFGLPFKQQPASFYQDEKLAKFMD